MIEYLRMQKHIMVNITSGEDMKRNLKVYCITDGIQNMDSDDYKDFLIK